MVNIGIDHKNVLLVGLSSGIGQSLCDIYFEKGFKVYATYNKTKLNESTSSKCKKIQKIDLSNKKGIDELLDFSEELKPANIVYLPGYIDGKSLYDNSLNSLQSSFNVNLFAYLLLISRTCGYMKATGYGRFLSLSSIGSKYGGGLNSLNYTIGKNALEYFPKEYKRLAEFNVFFNNIICGVTNTSIINNKRGNLISRIDKIPIRRMANPVEIALNCYRLCSHENTFQTLSNTTIAGGE